MSLYYDVVLQASKYLKVEFSSKRKISKKKITDEFTERKLKKPVNIENGFGEAVLEFESTEDATKSLEVFKRRFLEGDMSFFPDKTEQSKEKSSSSVNSCSEGDKTEDENNIDMYLMSSDEEGDSESASGSKSYQMDRKRATVTFIECTNMIVPLKLYKKTLLETYDSCPSVENSTIDTEETASVSEDLNEELLDDNTLNTDEPLLTAYKVTKALSFKKRSEYSELKVSPKLPLLPQLQTLASILENIPTNEDITDDFPCLIGQDHLAPVCLTLAKYSVFSQEDSISFDISDFGDKLVCELSSLNLSSLEDKEFLKNIKEMNQSNNKATVTDWNKMFCEKYQNFQDVNDLYGDDFSIKAIQVILLSVMKNLDVVDTFEHVVTGLIGLLEDSQNIMETVSAMEESEKVEDDEFALEAQITTLFNIRQFKDKIYVGVKSNDENEEAVIVVKDKTCFVHLENIYGHGKSLLQTRDSCDLYLIHVSDLVSLKCQLAIPLSAWSQETQSLDIFRNGFVLYQISVNEFCVALVDTNRMSTVTITTDCLKEIDEESVSLKTGTEIRLIMSDDEDVLMGIPVHDKVWDIINVTSTSGDDLQEIDNLIKDLVSAKTVSYGDEMKFLLMKASSQKSVYEAQRKILGYIRKSDKQEKKYSKCFTFVPLQDAKKRIFSQRHLLTLNETRVNIFGNVVKIEGNDEKGTDFTSKILQFTLGSVKKRNQLNFKEIKLGKRIKIQKSIEKQFTFKIKDSNLNNYDVFIHVDFSQKFKKLDCRVWKDFDKTVKLKIKNDSSEDVTIPSEQLMLILERINQS